MAKANWHKRDTCSLCGRNFRNTDFHLVVGETDKSKKHTFYSIEAKEGSEDNPALSWLPDKKE